MYHSCAHWKPLGVWGWYDGYSYNYDNDVDDYSTHNGYATKIPCGMSGGCSTCVVTSSESVSCLKKREDSLSFYL